MENKKNKHIVREKVWVDPEVMNPSIHPSDDYNVDYCLYTDNSNGPEYIPNNPTEEFNCDLISDACFYSVLSKASQDTNRICYMMGNPDDDYYVTKEEKLIYLKLAVEHGFLPEYICPEEVCDKNIVVFDLTDLTQAQLYIYLCICRFMEEYVGLTKSIVYLMSKFKMDFATALVIACKCTVSWSGHNFISVTSKYGANKNVANETTDIPLNIIMGINRFIKEPTKYDSNSVLASSVNSFKGEPIIREISKIKTTVSVQEAIDPLIQKALNSSDDDTATEWINKFDEIKHKIKYIEKDK